MEFMETSIIESYSQGTDIIGFKVKKPPGFSFLPGQYCILSLYVKNTFVNKPFSIACSPTKQYLEFATKNTGSDFKKTLASLSVNDNIKISKAMGNFVLDENAKHIIMLSGGIGITPLRSMLEYLIDKKLKTQVALIYSNKTTDDIPFLEELLEMKKTNNLKIELTITRPENGKPHATYRIGRIDATLVSQFSTPQSIYYLCGPSSMVQSMQEILTQLNIDTSKIKEELFSGY